MGVMMQAFYWHCPAIEGKPFQWWKHVEAEVARPGAASSPGFTAAGVGRKDKAAGNTLSGYDPFPRDLSASFVMKKVWSRLGSARAKSCRA